jgi:hypothetical protein
MCIPALLMARGKILADPTSLFYNVDGLLCGSDISSAKRLNLQEMRDHYHHHLCYYFATAARCCAAAFRLVPMATPFEACFFQIILLGTPYAVLNFRVLMHDTTAQNMKKNERTRRLDRNLIVSSNGRGAIRFLRCPVACKKDI